MKSEEEHLPPNGLKSLNRIKAFLQKPIKAGFDHIPTGKLLLTLNGNGQRH